MNGKLERILKEQLENYELPYESGAWEQFSKRLDGTPSTPFYRKWWFAASIGTVLVGSATFFALSSNEETPQKQLAKTEETTAVVSNQSSAQPTTHTIKGTSPTTGAQNSVNRATDIQTSHTDQHTTNVTKIDPPVHNPSGTINSGSGDHTNSTTTVGGNNGTTTPADTYVKPQLPSSICLNESFTIENPNEQSLKIIYPNGKTKTIRGKQSLEIRPTQSGTISVETGRSTESILVNEPSSELYINVDASVLYENGIPTLKFDVSGTENAISWESNIAARTSDRNHLVVHPFTEREVTVNAITHDQNGCKVVQTETIRMAEAYNLIAPTGFTPSSGDARTNTFIPAALPMRDTPFEMTIMDPNNMTVLYTTSDASMGWNGQDGRTGQQVQIGTTWLWKVVMKNPLPGEPREYKGLITVTGR